MSHNFSDEHAGGRNKPFDPMGVILAGRKAVAAAQQESEPAALPEEPDGFLSCMAGGDTYLIAISRVREALRPRCITQVPRAPESVSGIISHRGAIMPVVDLSLRLGMVRDTAPGSGWIIVLRRENGFCGLRVDNVGHVMTLPASAVEPAHPEQMEKKEIFSGMVHYRGVMALVLNLDKVLAVDATLH